MKKTLFIVLMLSVFAARGNDSRHRAADANQSLVNVSIDMTAVSNVVRLIYRDAFGGSYVLDPEVLKDERMVAFSFAGNIDAVRTSWARLLDSLGYEIQSSDGVDYVRPKHRVGRASGTVFLYRPNYRDVGQISEIMSTLVPENFVPGIGGGQIRDSAPSASQLKNVGDFLAFRGSSSEIERIKDLLQQVDIAQSDVIAHAVVYEVSNRTRETSAINLLLSLLNSKLNLGVDVSSVNPGSFISFKNSTVEAVLSALSSDSRFKVITNPRLRIQSGRTAHLSVGKDVPTLSGVSYVGVSGSAIQSISYKSAGVIFDLSPVVREKQIEVTVHQQISDFSRTDTGVNNSPTLIKRELSTSVAVQDGELIIIGGLQQRNQQNQRQGLSFLPGFLDSSSSETDETELVLLLQVSRLRPSGPDFVKPLP